MRLCSSRRSGDRSTKLGVATPFYGKVTMMTVPKLALFEPNETIWPHVARDDDRYDRELLQPPIGAGVTSLHYIS